jgi:hypothetical protein
VDDPDQRVRFGIGQWPDEHAVDHSENRRGRTNAERQHQDGCGGKSGLFPQGTRCVPHVLRQIVERQTGRRTRDRDRPTACLTQRSHVIGERVVLLQLFERELPGIVVTHAIGAKLLVTLVKMLRQLLDDFTLARRVQRE